MVYRVDVGIDRNRSPNGLPNGLHPFGLPNPTEWSTSLRYDHSIYRMDVDHSVIYSYLFFIGSRYSLHTDMLVGSEFLVCINMFTYTVV